MTSNAGLVVSAPCSGSGKTLVTRALIGALRCRGLVVQPFKAGPDYIDPQFHGGRRGSVNLDPFLASAPHLQYLFTHYGAGADVCIVEGMMGLFDGWAGAQGSTAEVAKDLDLPVLLVVDVSGQGYSLGALLKGFASFDAGLQVGGVLLNKVGSIRHERMLRQACADAGVPCWGCLPRSKDLAVPSRYLGLDLTGQAGEEEACGRWLEGHVDVEGLLQVAGGFSAAPASTARGLHPQVTSHATGASSPQTAGTRSPHFVVARTKDDAFSFLYREHLDKLSALGRVSFIDPEEEGELPSDTDLLYLPGGYPERHGAALEAARHLRASVKAYADGGGRVLAECGGMIYLCERLLTDEGAYSLCGVLPCTVSARQADRHLSLGYRRLVFPMEMELRGHEFHYTQFAGAVPPSDVVVRDAMGNVVPTPVFHRGGVIASYTHLYWGELSSPMDLFEGA